MSTFLCRAVAVASELTVCRRHSLAKGCFSDLRDASPCHRKKLLGRDRGLIRRTCSTFTATRGRRLLLARQRAVLTAQVWGSTLAAKLLQRTDSAEAAACGVHGVCVADLTRCWPLFCPERPAAAKILPAQRLTSVDFAGTRVAPVGRSRHLYSWQLLPMHQLAAGCVCYSAHCLARHIAALIRFCSWH